jgi:hypothetical protein
MKLVSVTMIKNDSDIVEAFVRHHAALLDHLVILDHGSTDATPSILQALRAEGLPLTVLHDASLSFQQGPRVTDLARNAFTRLGADFVFPLDADELLKVSSRQALEQALLGIPPGKCGQIAWQNYLVTAEDDAACVNPVERLRYRARLETKDEHKVVLGRSMLDDKRWQVSNGSHHLARDLASGTETAAATTLSGIHIAHFPLRSQEQLHQKIILGWLSYRLQNPVDIKAAGVAVSQNEQFWHWKDLFVSTLRNPNVTPAQLQQYAVAVYVHKQRISEPPLPVDLVEDPVATGYSLKYTGAEAGAALTSLARWTDQLLTRVGEML